MQKTKRRYNFSFLPFSRYGKLKGFEKIVALFFLITPFGRHTANLNPHFLNYEMMMMTTILWKIINYMEWWWRRNERNQLQINAQNRHNIFCSPRHTQTQSFSGVFFLSFTRRFLFLVRLSFVARPKRTRLLKRLWIKSEHCAMLRCHIKCLSRFSHCTIIKNANYSS